MTPSASESVARQIVDRIAAHPHLRLLGITGPPGAGKSTVCGLVARGLDERGIEVAGIVPMDGFHLSNAVLHALGRADRKGAPDTFDVDGYCEILRRVRRAEGTVFAPEYRRDMHEPIAASAAIAPRGIVLTEGNYLGVDLPRWRDVRGLLDQLVFIDTDRTELVRRLVARHKQHGRRSDEAAHWVRTVDSDNIDLVCATRSRADFTVRA